VQKLNDVFFICLFVWGSPKKFLGRGVLVKEIIFLMVGALIGWSMLEQQTHHYS